MVDGRHYPSRLSLPTYLAEISPHLSAHENENDVCMKAVDPLDSFGLSSSQSYWYVELETNSIQAV